MHVRLTVYRCCPGTYTRGMGGIIQSAGWNQKVLFPNSESGPGFSYAVVPATSSYEYSSPPEMWKHSFFFFFFLFVCSHVRVYTASEWSEWRSDPELSSWLARRYLK